MGRTSEEPTLRMESSSASDVKLAAVAEGLEHPGSRSCGRLRVPGSRFSGGQNGPGADSVEEEMGKEPTLWLGDRSGSRRCGCEIGLGANTADVMMVPGADFNCFEKDFSAVFQWNFRAENEKRGSDLMRQIARSHKGASPLDPRRPPETVALERRRLYVLGQFSRS